MWPPMCKVVNESMVAFLVQFVLGLARQSRIANPGNTSIWFLFSEEGWSVWKWGLMLLDGFESCWCCCCVTIVEVRCETVENRAVGTKKLGSAKTTQSFWAKTTVSPPSTTYSTNFQVLIREYLNYASAENGWTVDQSHQDLDRNLDLNATRKQISSQTLRKQVRDRDLDLDSQISKLNSENSKLNAAGIQK